MWRGALVDRGLGWAVVLVSIASCLPTFPEIECAKSSDCFSGMCSGARCVSFGEAFGVNAQSVLIVSSPDAVPEVHAFDVGAPIDVPAADQMFALFYSCALQGIGLEPGKVALAPASDAQPLPFPSVSFARDHDGAWSARDPYEVLESLRDVRIVSTFDPCPIWREHAFEMLGSDEASYPPFLIPRPGGAAVFMVPKTGLYRSDENGTEIVSTSTSITDAIVLNDDSIALLSYDRCLRRLGEQSAIACNAPSFIGLAPSSTTQGEIYLVYASELFVLTDAWRQIEIAPLVVPSQAQHLQAIAPADMLAAFQTYPTRAPGDFLRIRGSAIEVIPLPAAEEVVGFAASSDPSAVFVGTSRGSRWLERVYRFNGTAFSLFSTRADPVFSVFTRFQGGVIIAERTEVVAVPYPGRDCRVGSVQEFPVQVAALDDGSVVVLSQPTGSAMILSRFRQVTPGATCGLAP